jgi:hypothetical protein
MEQKISLKALNELLGENKHRYFMNQVDGHKGIDDNYYDGVQGEYNETFKFYKHPKLPEEVFMRETYHTNSYGDNENLVQVQFVEGKAKTITVYEPV